MNLLKMNLTDICIFVLQDLAQVFLNGNFQLVSKNLVQIQQIEFPIVLKEELIMINFAKKNISPANVICLFSVWSICDLDKKSCELISVNTNTQGRSVARCPKPRNLIN